MRSRLELARAIWAITLCSRLQLLFGTRAADVNMVAKNARATDDELHLCLMPEYIV